MTRAICCVALFALPLMAISASAQIFEDNFDDGNASSRWSAPIPAQEDPGIPFDGSVDYAFDYSVIGAPPAPNTTGGTTLGVAMETNTTDQCPDNDPNCTDADEGEAVGIVPLAGLADVPAGEWRLTADMYIYWNGLPGSTEYGTIGAFSGGTAAPLRFGLDPGDGLAWQFDGDGDSGTDILRFENPAVTSPPDTEFGLGGYEDIACNAIPNVNTGTPMACGFPGNAIVGPANQWVEMEIESIGGAVSVKMNGTTIDKIPLATFSGGTILLGQSDPFNSVNIDNANGNSNVVVFDNVVLQVPEPSCLVMLALAGLALVGIRRRG